MRLQRLDGTTQVTRLMPSAPSFVVAAVPQSSEVAATYLKLGVEHILGGVDHLLFVLALLLVVHGGKRIVATVTAFTVAHSLTLVAATLGWVHVPARFVELVCNEPLERPVGASSVYSDLGFILLGEIVVRSFGADLDRTFDISTRRRGRPSVRLCDQRLLDRRGTA